MKPAKITLRTGRDRAQAARWLDKCPLGYTLLFKPPTRTLAQNDRMWPFLEDIARQKDWPAGSGKMRTRYFWKDLFTAALTSQEIVPGLEGGLVAIGQHTSEMGVEDMSDLLQLIETWGTQNGVTFTDTPQENHAGTVASTAPDHGSSPAPAANLSPRGNAGARADDAETALAPSARHSQERT